jgi:NAD(P)-dependent dehydrogenase (short-subunit alcohol dehydrogenase family)
LIRLWQEGEIGAAGAALEPRRSDMLRSFATAGRARWSPRMKDLAGKVAVVTGAASGIGFAMAERFARAGMRLALADVERRALDEAAARLAALGAPVLALPTDVADAGAMDALGARVLERYGAVHVVCNNAGVAGGGPTWELGTADWEFVLRPNLWGVIHGVRVFTRHLVAQNEGHIVNTASLAGLISVPGLAPYNVSKHAVVTLSETLHAELRGAGSRVGVSVLCPGFVRTRIFESERHRPSGWTPRAEDAEVAKQRQALLDGVLRSAMAPEQVAERVEDAIRNERFYILTHAGSAALVEQRLRAILEGANPPLPQPLSFAGPGAPAGD